MAPDRPSLPAPQGTAWHHNQSVAGLGIGLILVIAGLLLEDVQKATLAIASGVALILLVAVILGRRARSAARDLRGWQQLVSDELVWLHDSVQWLALRTLIHETRVDGWQVDFLGGGGGVRFTSPGGKEAIVPLRELNDQAVAGMLHQADPEHWGEHWRESLVQNVVENDLALRDLNTKMDTVESQVKRLREGPSPTEQKAIEELAKRKVALDARKWAEAALADTEADAKRRDWSVQWGDRLVVFEKGDDVATVKFDSIDVRKIRDALGLDLPLSGRALMDAARKPPPSPKSE